MKNELTGLPLTNEELASVSALALRQIQLGTEILETEKKLEELKTRHREISTRILPEAMLALGLTSFSLTNGSKVQLSKFYNAKIPENRKVEALNWLRTHNHGDIIREDITVSFRDGKDDEVKKLTAAIDKLGYAYSRECGIHHSTLKAFVREMIETGKPVPLDLFGAYVGNITKIELP